jgi:hypothetical protein
MALAVSRQQPNSQVSSLDGGLAVTGAVTQAGNLLHMVPPTRQNAQGGYLYHKCVAFLELLQMGKLDTGEAAPL